MTGPPDAPGPGIITKKDRGMDKSIVKLAPSILSADFANLGEQVNEAERADANRIHVDIMEVGYKAAA